jgi:hypothetical protein
LVVTGYAEVAVDEREWLPCADPKRMLEILRGKASERKLRLFLAASARSVWIQMVDPIMRGAVEAAERLADGLASLEEHETAHLAVYGLASQAPGLSENASRMGVTLDEYAAFVGLALSCGFSKKGLDQITRMNTWVHGTRLTGQKQPALLREIFGNPFHPVTLDSAWQTSTVVALAQAAYDERQLPSGHLHPDRLAVLADALEEAGCQSEDILGHLRQPGAVHVRGCHVVDLLLAKE